MVIGESREEQENSENRVCPCVPALTKEIPSNGSCHCGIFCTQDKANQILNETNMHDAVATHSRGLTKEECEKLLTKEEVDSLELESLLEARELGFVKFNLVDTIS